MPIKELAISPAPLLLLALLGLLFGRRFGVLWLISVLALVSLAALSTPRVSNLLMAQMESADPLPPDTAPPAAEAIVILGGDGVDEPEFGGFVPGALSLVRLRYGASLQRRTGLPVLVSGGPWGEQGPHLADAMKTCLETQFQVPVRWVERESHDTWENAAFSAEILKSNEVRRVLLVTHAWHMPRAVAAFQRAGLDPVPAPTGFESRSNHKATPGFDAFVPSARALLSSYYALHEMVGQIYYDLRYRLQ